MTASNPKNRRPMETLFAMLSIFSFFVLSVYLVIWRESNHDLRIAGAMLILFALGITFSHNKAAVIGASFLFAGIRWGIGALFTWDRRAIVATVVLIAVPLLMIVVAAKRHRADC